MHLFGLRTVALAAALVAPAAMPQAHAADGDTITYIGRFYAGEEPAVDASVVDKLVAGTGVANPQHCQGNPHSHIHNVYADAYTRYPANPYEPPEILYVWHADGFSQLDNLYCVRSSRITVTITDDAPGGYPRSVPGAEPGTGRWWVEATPEVAVTEFQGSYVRGRGTLTVVLTGSWTYYVDNDGTKTATAALPCVKQVWTVTPTPTRAIFDSGPTDVPC